jgi:hypothetical protein
MQDLISPSQQDAPHSICLFIPYFGKPPGYMPIFLKSCLWNPTIQWFIHSDADWSHLSIPSNVRIIPATLGAIAELAEKTLECKVSLPRAYKLCDLRPMYGLLFADLAKGFDFWGHCDLDLIFGDVRAFIPTEALETSLRIFENGHLSIYRNNEAGCNAFRLSTNDINYRDILADPVYRVFDENGINRIFLQHNLPTYRHFRASATIGPQHQDFCVWGERSNIRPRVYVWRKGKTFREFYENGEFKREEFAYVHIMRRYMVLTAPDMVDSCDNWLMVPNSIIPTGEMVLTAQDMQEMNKPSLEHHIRWQIKRMSEYLQRRKYQPSIRRQYGYRK